MAILSESYAVIKALYSGMTSSRLVRYCTLNSLAGMVSPTPVRCRNY